MPATLKYLNCACGQEHYHLFSLTALCVWQAVAFVFLFYLDFEAVCPSVIPAWLELMILLPQPPKCRDYSCVPCLALGKLHYLRKPPSFFPSLLFE